MSPIKEFTRFSAEEYIDILSEDQKALNGIKQS
jgi:hypothetical protein